MQCDPGKMKAHLNVCLLFALFAAFTAAAQIDAHFILLAKHPKYVGKSFILLERREHLWELPHVNTKADLLKTDAGLLESVSRATFRTVPINPQHVAKFDNQGKDMVVAAMSGRDVNQVLLENELNRLAALNPDVRELRWVEYTAAAFANKDNFANTQCLSIDDNIGACELALNNFPIGVLSDSGVRANINHLLSGQTLSNTVDSLNVSHGSTEPSVIQQHFMIASKYEENERQHYWYFYEHKGVHRLPLVPNVTSAKDYPVKVKKHYGLEYKTAGNQYTEISYLHHDAGTNQYYSVTGHVHSKNDKVTDKTGSVWCTPQSVVEACLDNTKFTHCLDAAGNPHDVHLTFDKERLCPLLTNITSHYRFKIPDGNRTAGVFLVRTVNGKRYSLFMARDDAEGGWTVPGGNVDFPEDYQDAHDPLLVGALRELDEETFRSIKLDIDKVEKECTTITKNDRFGTIFRYKLCSIENNPAHSSAEIRKKTLTVVDPHCKEEAGNVRWICLDDVMKAAKAWGGKKVPLVVEAETLSDDETRTYRSNYRLFHPGIDVLLQVDFPKALERAMKKDNSFNSAYMKHSIVVNNSAHAGALMLDAATGMVGFAKDKNGNPHVPITGKLERIMKKVYIRFKAVGEELGLKVFKVKKWDRTNTNDIHPILNYDTLVNDIGVSKNILLFDKSVTTSTATDIEWIKIDQIAAHPKLSVEDKAIFADASCQESLNYWVAFYTGKVDLTAKPPQKTADNNAGGNTGSTTPPQNTNTKSGKKTPKGSNKSSQNTPDAAGNTDTAPTTPITTDASKDDINAKVKKPNATNSSGKTTKTSDTSQGKTLTPKPSKSTSQKPANLVDTEGDSGSSKNSKITPSDAGTDAVENGNETETPDNKQQKSSGSKSQNPKTSDSQDSTLESDSTGMSSGKIAIICLSVLVGLALVGGLIYFISRKK